MIKIYHNSRCSKSREGLKVVEESGKKFEVVKYLEDIPTKDELRNIIMISPLKHRIGDSIRKIVYIIVI